MMMKFVLAVCLCCSGQLLLAQWSETGTATYYADKLHGQRTTSGELYDRYDLTAAHHLLPLGSRIRVTRLDNNLSVEVRVNDCFKTFQGRVVDLSRAAAEQLNLIRIGTARVKVELITKGKGKTCTPGAVIPDVQPPVPASNPDTTQTTTVATTSTVPTPDTPPAPWATPSSGIYRADALEPIREGFGVQIGAFSARENAVLLLSQMKGIDFHNLLIAFAEGTSTAPFKVIVGPYETREEAVALQGMLLTKHQLQGIVVDLSK
jgi:rare lipoprotein A